MAPGAAKKVEFALGAEGRKAPNAVLEVPGEAVTRQFTRHQKAGKVMAAPGVWVREREGVLLCGQPRCRREPMSLTPRHRGMCQYHYTTRSDGRPRCLQCSQFAIEPYADQLCELHHPNERELTPFETQVLERVRNGEHPLVATQTVLGPGTGRQEAKRELNGMLKRAAVLEATREAMGVVGIDDTYLFTRLKENCEAERTIYGKEGELGREPDTRGRNQALDMAFKLRGMYPEKTQRAQEKQQVQLAVVLPQERRIEADTPVYTIEAAEEET
jgi:hypothetical protein